MDSHALAEEIKQEVSHMVVSQSFRDRTTLGRLILNTGL